MIALFLLRLLPILRNTVTGLDSVSPAVVESARGMGMNSFQQLMQVRLPLAWPVIMAGVRVSSLMTVGIAAIAVLVGGSLTLRRSPAPSSPAEPSSKEPPATPASPWPWSVPPAATRSS